MPALLLLAAAARGARPRGLACFFAAGPAPGVAYLHNVLVGRPEAGMELTVVSMLALSRHGLVDSACTAAQYCPQVGRLQPQLSKGCACRALAPGFGSVSKDKIDNRIFDTVSAGLH